jgi:hypothetical protein
MATPREGLGSPASLPGYGNRRCTVSPGQLTQWPAWKHVLYVTCHTDRKSPQTGPGRVAGPRWEEIDDWGSNNGGILEAIRPLSACQSPAALRLLLRPPGQTGHGAEGFTFEPCLDTSNQEFLFTDLHNVQWSWRVQCRAAQCGAKCPGKAQGPSKRCVARPNVFVSRLEVRGAPRP